MSISNVTDIDIMHEFIQLRNNSEPYLSTILRVSGLEEKLISREYYDSFCVVADISCSLKLLSSLSENEENKLSYLTEILKIKAAENYSC